MVQMAINTALAEATGVREEKGMVVGGGGGMREVMWDDDNGEKRETGDINDGKEPGKS